MIKGAAVAGAAAWTAPVIIDSLSSPAAADSACTIYWVKVTAGGSCFSACPGNIGMFPVSDALWAGSCGEPGGCDAGDGATHMPSSVTAGNPNYSVALGSNCYFSSSTGWQIGGRYNNSYLYGSASSGSSTGTVPWKNGSVTLDYIYLKFCCPPAATTTTRRRS